MFAADTLGITEDAATGGAMARSARLWPSEACRARATDFEIVSLRATAWRPSTVRIRLELRDGRASAIQVGGSVVPVLEGVLTLP